VAKLVPKEPGAERELLFEDLGGARNVVPIIDSRETDDCFVLIMPRAEKSLRQHLDEAAGPLSVPDAVAILSDAALALADLDGKVVHRDLKPENILLLGGNWCLADFGISRYAEATTAPDTRKYALSPPYAAPERWREERATTQTDVYSLGVIAYEMLSGSLPFAGPASEDFREQHVHGNSASLDGVPTALGALVDECLYKAPEARPSPASVFARLSRIEEPPLSPGLAKLQEASRVKASQQSESDRRASEQRSETERRAVLASAASDGLTKIARALKAQIKQFAPAAAVPPQGHPMSGWIIGLNMARLEFGKVAETVSDPWGTKSHPAFDVVAHAVISVRFPPNRHQYEGRSHSLWYCDAQESGRYKWFETAFMISPLVDQRSPQNPFALEPGEEAASAEVVLVGWTG